jgi:hypothetical protein
MNSPAHDIAVQLNSLSQGQFPPAGGTWPVYVNLEPATPDNVITIYDTGGPGPDTNEMDVASPTFQVRVRAALAVDAYDKQAAIKAALLAARDYAGASSILHAFYVMESDVLSLGTDDNNRHIRVANYHVHRG